MHQHETRRTSWRWLYFGLTFVVGVVQILHVCYPMYLFSLCISLHITLSLNEFYDIVLVNHISYWYIVVYFGPFITIIQNTFWKSILFSFIKQIQCFVYKETKLLPRSVLHKALNIVRLLNHARIHAWNQSVLSNEDNVFCSMKQQEPMMGFKLITDRLGDRGTIHFTALSSLSTQI